MRVGDSFLFVRKKHLKSLSEAIRLDIRAKPHTIRVKKTKQAKHFCLACLLFYCISVSYFTSSKSTSVTWSSPAWGLVLPAEAEGPCWAPAFWAWA